MSIQKYTYTKPTYEVDVQSDSGESLEVDEVQVYFRGGHVVFRTKSPRGYWVVSFTTREAFSDFIFWLGQPVKHWDGYVPSVFGSASDQVKVQQLWSGPGPASGPENLIETRHRIIRLTWLREEIMSEGLGAAEETHALKDVLFIDAEQLRSEESMDFLEKCLEQYH